MQSEIVNSEIINSEIINYYSDSDTPLRESVSWNLEPANLKPLSQEQPEPINIIVAEIIVHPFISFIEVVPG